MQASTIGFFMSSPLGVACYAVFFIAVFSITGFGIATLTGWSALAKRFRAGPGPYGECKTAGPFLYTVYLRYWTHYSSVIRLTAAADAMYLSVLLPFRIGHPPLRIPWDEIQFGRARRLWRNYVVLTLGSAEQIPMRIPERMARNLGILERVPA
jgi:hypothetical protein